MLALNELLALRSVRSIGFVTPYLDGVQARIIANYRALGFEVRGERHLGLQDNFSFSGVTPEQLRTMVREVAAEKPDAVVVVCTNLHAAPLAEALEMELGVAVYDTIATATWKALRVSGVDARRVVGWGRLFQA